MATYRDMWNCKTDKEYIDLLELALKLASDELDQYVPEDEKEVWGCEDAFDWRYELKANARHMIQSARMNRKRAQYENNL